MSINQDDDKEYAEVLFTGDGNREYEISVGVEIKRCCQTNHGCVAV